MAVNEQLAREASTTLMEAKDLSGAVSRTPEELANIVSLFASSDRWMDKVRLRAERRWYERLCHGPDYDIWVLSWLPGQSTGFHDHGASSGAFVVATGVLEEHRPGKRNHVMHPGKPRAFGPDYTHDVRNLSLAPAISIHAYSPPLSEMNEYELDGSQLVPRERSSLQAETLDPVDRTGALTIEQVLSAARARLRRQSPDEVYAAVTASETVLVDIRPEIQRAIELLYVAHDAEAALGVGMGEGIGSCGEAFRGFGDGTDGEVEDRFGCFGWEVRGDGQDAGGALHHV